MLIFFRQRDFINPFKHRVMTLAQFYSISFNRCNHVALYCLYRIKPIINDNSMVLLKLLKGMMNTDTTNVTYSKKNYHFSRLISFYSIHNERRQYLKCWCYHNRLHSNCFYQQNCQNFQSSKIIHRAYCRFSRALPSQVSARIFVDKSSNGTGTDSRLFSYAF